MRYRVLVDEGAGLGLRQGEAFGLDVDDVDFLRGTVHVRRQVKLVGGVLFFASPKGGKERDVPLGEAVGFRLARHLELFPPVDVTLPWKTPDGPPVTHRLIVTSGQHKAMNRNYMNAFLWKPALVAAGVLDRPAAARRHGFHGFRHTYASAMLAEGVDIRALAEFLGHHSAAFTLEVYCHLMPAAEDRARAAADRLFSPAGALAVPAGGGSGA
ncbi:MAG: tyrosine-type recombinase/integrase [Mycobacteriales bacterium]